MPAAAVIPASAASIKVAAVKRLAVECLYRAQVRWTLGRGSTGSWMFGGLRAQRLLRLFHTPPSVTSLLARVHNGNRSNGVWSEVGVRDFGCVLLLSAASSSIGFTVTLSKSECSKQS